MTDPFVLTAAAGAGAYALARAHRRLQLSLAKQPGLSGHTRLAKRVAGLIPGYAYDEARFFDSDGAPAEVVARRREAFAALCLLVFFVWWTMFSGRKRGERSDSERE